MAVVDPAALIIGAGIAGIQAALDIADAGFKVYLVERASSIGGKMAQLDKTFPTLDCSSCILTPRMAEVAHHPHITLLTCTEVTAIAGEAGAFHVTLEKHPRYVDVARCTGCGLCAQVCPVTLPNTFNLGLDTHKAIYRRFPQAVPAAYVIEKLASPCKLACPAHIPVQGYIALIAQGKFKEALALIRQAGVPFAGTLGRVCYHPCEASCKRAAWDEPVAVCALKRFAYDAAAGEELPPGSTLTTGSTRQQGTAGPPPAAERWAERVAVIGAGPAGLTAAYDLARQGYRVTVFDALPEAGGMLAAGIPAYRLPRQVLRHEIDSIRALGVEIRLNTPVGRDGGPSLADLRREYGAIFLAVGAQGSSRLGLPGEDLPGVLQAVPFLQQLNLGGEVQVGKRVAVVGGGNSAIDAARCARRLGAQVQLIYRRSRAEMPAASWEVAAAEAEGVELNFLQTPVRICERNGRIAGLECIRMALGEPDASGRRRPVPISGSEFPLEVDTLILAIGQTVEADGLDVASNRGQLAVNRDTLETSLPGVFAGGDAVTGPASVVEAIGAGLQAAESIHRYLRGSDLLAGRTRHWPKPEDIAEHSRSINPVNPVHRQTRQRMPELAPAERVSGFQEIELGFNQEQAVAEAQRCLSCAICSECSQCVTACHRKAVRPDDQPAQIELDVSSILVATGFEVFDPRHKPELGYGVYPQVITTLEFERLASASGPTAGKIVLDGRAPEKVVFIQCVGSRQYPAARDRSLGPATGCADCSRVCCMVVAKQAHLAHERLPGAEITVFYMDVRAFGKGFEEFYDRVRQEGVRYRRGSPAEIIRRREGEGAGYSGAVRSEYTHNDTHSVIVRAEDTLLGELVEVEADMVVLAIGILPALGAAELAEVLHLARDKAGFFQEAHEKLQTVESSTAGIFLAGCCQGPKDIPDTVAHAKAAASAAKILLAGKGVGHASG